MERSQTSSEGKQAEDGFFRGDHFLFTYTIAFIHEPYNIFIMSTRCIPAHKAAQAGRQTGEQVRKGAFCFIWRGSLLVSGRWRPPRPSVVSAAPRDGTVCCSVCWSPSRSPSRRLKRSPGWLACPSAVLGLSRKIWGAATGAVF